jgi:hypothetical protein
MGQSAQPVLGSGGFLMGYHFEFDSANRILKCRLYSPVTDESLTECYRTFGEYAELTAPSSGLFDASAVASFEVSPETVRVLATMPPVFPDTSLPRVMVAPAPQVFGLARLFELAGQETRPNLHVVRTLREAYVILGVQAPNWQPFPSDA